MTRTSGYRRVVTLPPYFASCIHDWGRALGVSKSVVVEHALRVGLFEMLEQRRPDAAAPDGETFVVDLSKPVSDALHNVSHQLMLPDDGVIAECIQMQLCEPCCLHKNTSIPQSLRQGAFDVLYGHSWELPQ